MLKMIYGKSKKRKMKLDDNRKEKNMYFIKAPTPFLDECPCHNRALEQLCLQLASGHNLFAELGLQLHNPSHCCVEGRKES